MPNGNLLCCNGPSLTIFSKHLKELKVVEQFDFEKFNCLYATTDKKKLIYLTNRDSHEVIITDLELNKLSSTGNKGSFDNQFNCPEDIFYYKAKIYICDHFNKRIQVLNEDLSFDSRFQVESYPSQIRITKNLCCITATSSIYYYDLKSFNMKIKHSMHGAGRLSLLADTYFYKYLSFNGVKFKIFNNEGQLVEDVQAVGELTNFIDDWSDGCLVNFNGKILISSYNHSKLVVTDEY